MQANEALPNYLTTLLLPLKDKQLILPNTAIAEIVKFKETIVDQDDVPNWFKGYLEWRELKIPLISFEAINDEPFEGRHTNKNIAVLNGLDRSSMPFYGLIIQGIPRSLRLTDDDILKDKNYDVGPMELSGVFVAGDHAVIPDLNKIQDKIVSVLEIL